MTSQKFVYLKDFFHINKKYPILKKNIKDKEQPLSFMSTPQFKHKVTTLLIYHKKNQRSVAEINIRQTRCSKSLEVLTRRALGSWGAIETVGAPVSLLPLGGGDTRSITARRPVRTDVTWIIIISNNKLWRITEQNAKDKFQKYSQKKRKY